MKGGLFYVVTNDEIWILKKVIKNKEKFEEGKELKKKRWWVRA